jgi:gliding motility-associated-like protein
MLVFFLAFSTFHFQAYSQLIGTFSYGGDGVHEVSSVVKNDQGEVFLIGSAFNEADEDILVIKHSAEGEFLWSKFYGVNGNVETARSAVTDGEGGLYVIGQSSSPSSTEAWSGAYLIRIAQNGDVVFSNRYTANSGGAVSETGITMTRIGDALYIGGLAFQGVDSFWSDYFIIQTGLNGSTNWSQSYGASEFQGISTLSKGNGQSLISTGQLSGNSPTVDYVAGIGKYDLNGSPIWLRSLEYGTNFNPKTIQALDDGYALFGVSDFDMTGLQDLVLIRVNENGETIWSKKLQLPGDETAIDMKIIDNQIVITGYADGFADQSNHIVVSSFDQNGNMLWEKGINESANDFVLSERENLIIESIGDFVQVGYTAFADDGSGSSEFRLTHVSPNQENTCGEFDPNFDVVDIVVTNSEITLDPEFSFTNFVVGSYSQDTDLDTTMCLSEVNIIIPDSLNFCYNALDTIETSNLIADSYLWSTNETTQDIVPQDEGWYWVEVEVNELFFTDSVFITITTPTIDLGPDQVLCAGEEFEIEPEGEYNSLSWMSGEDFNLNVSEAGNYWAEAELDSCFAQDTIVIEVIEEPEVNIEDNLLICSPTDSVLVESGLDDSYEFTWDNGGENSQSYYSATGSHWLEVEIEDCAFDFDFEIAQASQNLIEETQLSICDGNSIDIELIDPAMNGSWNIGESGNSIEVEDAGVYVVELYEQDCFLSDSIQVEVIESPAYELEDQEVCPGSTYEVETPTFADQVWVNGIETNESEVSLYAGNHQVEYLFDECVFNSRFDVDYIEDTLDFDNHHFICEGDTITLSIDSLYNPVWDGFVEDSAFTISQPGIYDVAFEMFDCTFRESIEVVNNESCPCPEPVFIPNSFTPNSDGNNEFFKPVIYCPLDEYKLTIFDRWGQIVFDSNDPEKVWDGSNRAGDYFIQNDTYQYVLQFSKKSSSDIKVIRGHVTVVR